MVGSKALHSETHTLNPKSLNPKPQGKGGTVWLMTDQMGCTTPPPPPNAPAGQPSHV